MGASTVIQEFLAEIPESELAFDDIAFIFSQELHSLMQKQRMNQAQLAQKAGVAESRISKILSGNANITLKTIAQLMVALDGQIKFDIQCKKGEKWSDKT